MLPTMWGNCLLRLKNYDEARYKEAIVFLSDKAPLLSNWGVALAKMGKYEAAIEKYNEAIKLNSNFSNAYLNWGNALHKLGKHQEAEEKYKLAEMEVLIKP